MKWVPKLFHSVASFQFLALDWMLVLLKLAELSLGIMSCAVAKLVMTLPGAAMVILDAMKDWMLVTE